LLTTLPCFFLVFVAVADELDRVTPLASVLVDELEESVATFLPWSPTTVVLLESDWLDCDVLWANIAEAANNDTRMSLFMQLTTAIRWPTAKLKQMRTL
jgi:hypothetical protein